MEHDLPSMDRRELYLAASILPLGLVTESSSALHR